MTGVVSIIHHPIIPKTKEKRDELKNTFDTIGKQNKYKKGITPTHITIQQFILFHFLNSGCE
jgi:hypothetical protein